MPRLSSSATDLKDHYTVVVVGSGYGGGIAASRLARAGQAVCVLERGREFQPGEYPQHLDEAAAELQVDGPDGHVGSRTGLYDMRVNPDINVYMACGLGGTSLINANVSLRAEPRVFDDPRWPSALRADLATRIEAGYAQAESMLKPTTTPGEPTLAKQLAQQKAAKALGEPFKRTPINVHFGNDGPNHVGVDQHPCTNCGDCMTGCNHGAKNTLIMNYLPDAKNHGAEIYCECAVRWVERRGDRWAVHYQLLDVGRERFDAPTLTVTADVVVLAAGTLGSTEILLRSREKGLGVSAALGKRFTGNGDVLGFAYDTDEPIRGVGYGHRAKGSIPPVGPCITSVIDAREKPVLEDGMVIEEGSIAGPFAAIVPAVMAGAAGIVGDHKGQGIMDRVRAVARSAESALLGAYHGATQHMQTYLIMAHDDGAGTMELEGDRLRVRWPGVGDQPVFQRANARLKQASESLGGTYIRNPTWTRALRHEVITVHPLGGCVMAEDAGSGVTNHKGQVFAGDAGTAVHDGLYVCDGAVIPRSLGVNPLLTIAAVAERNIALLAEDRGWRATYTLPSAPAKVAAAAKLGIQFTETMRGWFSSKVKDDYARAADQGKADGSPFAFTLTIRSDDMDAMLSDPQHAARIVGSVEAPALSATPMTATRGVFNLFSDDPEVVNGRRMWYRMLVTSDEGKSYSFEGYKKVKHDRGRLDMWPDTSTLYISVWEGEKAEGMPLGRGILHIQPADFAQQMRTLKVLNAETLPQRLAAMARFGKFFAGDIWDVYGGALAPATVLRPDAPARARRQLRTPPPTVHSFMTEDNVHLRLTRYHGGNKGPVIMAPGFGTSSLAFTIDTVDTNLPEMLVANGYDTWVLDYRASPDLPSAKTLFSVDEVATLDWPAAVAEVRRITGAESVQAVGHCVGSLSLLLGLLSGMEGVRSAFCSALTPHPVAPFLTNVKTQMHLGQLLISTGFDVLTTDVDPDRWQEQMFDQVMKLYPSHEGCRSEVCRRVLFMYGEVYRHDMLNEATHDAIHEMFGVANVLVLKHVTDMVRAGHPLDRRGKDVYSQHVGRLKMPIAFMHGAENRMFLPEGSKRTYDWLVENNGPEYYVRHVVPIFGHMDCFMGKDSARDVFPVIVKELDRWA